MLKNLSIVFASPGEVELVKSETEEIKDNEVLVEIAFSAISSGTEKAKLSGETNVAISAIPDPFPRRSGYSSSGTVIDTGKSVTSVKKGDRVALSWSVHSRYCILEEKNVHKIPSENIGLKEAALWHIASFPLAAIRKCRLETGECAGVFGAGVLGIMAVKLLKASGAAPIFVCDPIEEKRKKALKAGADFAFDPFSSEYDKKIKEITGGGNVIIEVTGNGGGLNGALDCAARFARIALLGCTRHSDFTVDYYKKVHGPGITLVGAHTMARPEHDSFSGWWTTADDMAAIGRLVMYNRLAFEDLIDEAHSPLEAKQVYSRLLSPEPFPVCVFDWSKI